MTNIVWIFTVTARIAPQPPLRLWCVLRRAIPGGRISTLCCAGDGFSGGRSYEPSLVSTERPNSMTCPQCERELAAGTPGAAVAVEPQDYDELAIAREPTADLRKPPRVGAAAVGEWT